jgi:hypothetical protein
MISTRPDKTAAFSFFMSVLACVSGFQTSGSVLFAIPGDLKVTAAMYGCSSVCDADLLNYDLGKV